MTETNTIRIEVDGRVYELVCGEVEFRKALHALDERLSREAADAEAERMVGSFNSMLRELGPRLERERQEFERRIWEGTPAVWESVEQVTAPWPPQEQGRYTWPEPRRRRGR